MLSQDPNFTPDETSYITVYTGSEVNVQHLTNLLNDAKIETFVKNNFQSGLRSGFGGGLPGQVQLKVHQDQLTAAKKIVREAFPPQPNEEE